MIEKFKYTDKEKDAILSSMVIMVDTREKKADHILKYFDKTHIEYKKKTLNYGDYSFYIPKNEKLSIPRDLYFDKQIIVERKGSLEELSGNLTQGRDRLEKELSLAPSKKVIIIENATYADMVNGNYNTKYNNKSYWASIHTLWHKYDVPIVFMPDNAYTGFFIRGYFEYYLKNILR